MFQPSLKIALLFFFILTLDGRVLARAGSLDPTFGNGGVVLTEPLSGNISAIAVQPADGKILIAGGRTQSEFILLRYHPNGTPDASFGEGGIVRTRIFDDANNTAVVRGLAIQPDGKIIAAGDAAFSVPLPPAFQVLRHLTVVRYNSDGSLDTTFDGDGKVTILLDRGAYGEEVALQTDGKIVVAGWQLGTANDFVVARFLTNGALDATFDGDGIVTTAFSGTTDSKAQDVKIQPDGKILAAGWTRSGAFTLAFAAARYKPDGSLDDSFGDGGKKELNVNAADSAHGLELQADGKIILAGTTQITSAGSPQFSMARLTAGGALDNSFGTGGKVTTTFGSSAINYDVLVQADGRIVTVGEGNEINEARDFTLVRYLTDGTLDNSFDGDGKVLTSILRYERATAATLDNNGKILVTGETNAADGTGLRFAIVRYNTRAAAFCDFDGDGRTDISVFRPSGGFWYRLNSSNNAFVATQFGAAGDLIAPADFDGDGKTDIAVFRPIDGGWYRLNSSNNTFSATQFGTIGDLPTPGDFDGDGRADISVFRPADGFWYRLNSSNNQFVAAQFGASGDKPIASDFDGDGKADLTVWRPSDGGWYRINSSNNSFSANQFGSFGDLPVAADYDGDGKTDLAVYRPSAGSWYRINSGSGQFIAANFGIAEDKPAPGDFDGDGRADLAVFRPSAGTWYLLRSTSGFAGIQFGANNDIPTPSAFVR